MPYYANVYEVDRCYGGQEEGGWWFTTYTPKVSRKCWTKFGAEFRLGLLKDKFDKIEPEWDLHSVNYDGGVFDFRVEKNEAEHEPQGPVHYA